MAGGSVMSRCAHCSSVVAREFVGKYFVRKVKYSFLLSKWSAVELNINMYKATLVNLLVYVYGFLCDYV